MIIIELTYKKPLAEVDHYLIEHRQFLAECYKQGIFIASGPKEPRDGGIIIAHSDDIDIPTLMKNDPFYREGIADYRFITFKPNKVSLPNLESATRAINKV